MRRILGLGLLVSLLISIGSFWYFSLVRYGDLLISGTVLNWVSGFLMGLLANFLLLGCPFCLLLIVGNIEIMQKLTPPKLKTLPPRLFLCLGGTLPPLVFTVWMLTVYQLVVGFVWHATDGGADGLRRAVPFVFPMRVQHAAFYMVGVVVFWLLSGWLGVRTSGKISRGPRLGRAPKGQ